MESAEATGKPTPSRPAKKDPSRILAFAIAALLIFPFLGKSGIWDPYELDTADLARRVAINVMHRPDLALPNANNALPTLSDLKMGELPFTSMALGFRLFGLHDWTGRLPLAIWGFLGVVALYEFLARFVDRRAGLYAAIALSTMPLYFMQARTMLGDIVTMAALVFAFVGLAGAVLEGEDGDLAIGPRAGWMLLAILGLVSGYLSRGAIIGVAVPALAVGLSWIVLRGAGEGKGQPVRDVVGAIALGTGAVALGIGVFALLRASADQPLQRVLGFALLKKTPTEATFDLCVRQLGHALFPWSAFLPFAIGRLFRAPEGDHLRDREVFVRVALLVGAAVTYGAFALIGPYAGTLPFTGTAILAAIAAVAILDFERGAPPSRALALGCLVLGFVLYADISHEPERAMSVFVVERPQFPKTFEVSGGHQMLLALAFFAGLVGLTWFEAQPRERGEGLSVWIRDRVEGYRSGLGELASIWNGNLLFGLVVVEAALIGLGAMVFIGMRAGWAPVKSIGSNGTLIALNLWWLAAIGAASLPVALYLLRDGFRVLVDRTRASRASFTLVAALLAGATQSFWYYPALAAQLSPKEVFDAYARLHGQGEPLALLGVRARAAAYYSGGEVQSFNDVSQAFAWLTEKPAERRWMVVKADDLPRLNSLYRALFATHEGSPAEASTAEGSARTEGQVWHGPSPNELPAIARNLPVLDGRSSQILLVSNQLGNHANESWISKMVLEAPPRPTHPIDVSFEDQVECFGWEVTDKSGALVDSVSPATAYHLRFYYRVMHPVTGSWKAFVHIDGFQRRFNGDHNVLDGRYAMSLWQPGDVIVDDLDFQLEPNFTPGDYTVYFGFFTGETRFKVTRGAQNDNRAIAGAIHVR